MEIRPITFREASDFINRNHRHHKTTVGCKFCIGLYNGEKLIGSAVCGRPKSNIAHHKIRFRDCYDNENIAYDVSNGICLCKRCHKMVHGGGNYING